MVSQKYFYLLLSVITVLMLVYSTTSYGASITRDWFSKDKSKATVVIKGGETIRLPKKGGGVVTLRCQGAVSCTVTLADFKDKRGNITYDTDISGLQTVYGDINEGYGRFNITTTGDLEGLFSSSIATATLTDSTGLIANIGLPGDQLSQGGDISFSTRWFSNDVIGIDPVTFDEIILGDFFLDSIAPLTAFDYSVDGSLANAISASFTTGQQYTFSTGLQVMGEVSKSLHTVPLPLPVWLFASGLVALLALRKNPHTGKV